MIFIKGICAGLLGICLVVIAQVALAGPSAVERLADDVGVIRDDAGNWGGSSMGITHQSGPDYQAKKILDLSAVPEELWKTITGVRLSAYFCVMDYSAHVAKQTNGLDEAIEIVVNGNAHRIASNAGLPIHYENKPMAESMQWHDFELPKAELVRGPNEIILRMAPPLGKTPDDYLYLGIDNTVSGGNSWVKLNRDETWRQDKLTVPGGKGEYMVRLFLLSGLQERQAVWRPGEGRTEDPQGLLLYAGSHGDDARVEWRIDRSSPITVEVELADNRAFEPTWLDEAGKPVSPPIKAQGPRFQTTLSPPLTFVPSGIRFAKELPLRSVTLKARRDYHPVPRQIDMAPHIAATKGVPVVRTPSCRIDGNRIELDNKTLRCRFNTSGGRLRLESLYNEIAAAEMIRQPDSSALFMVEVGGKRYEGSRDFVCRAVAPMKTGDVANRSGFTATLFSEDLKLEAVLSVWIDDSLRMGVSLTNRREQPVDFKLAFPHFSGLAISDQPADDYYFFPWGGGVMADAPAIIRRGYGDHEAIYQVMDIFSPARGAGLAVACSDQDGRHKVLALRKCVPGQPEINGDMANTPTADEYKWTNSLPPTPGIGITYEYLRRTRKPGESFAAKDVAISAHAGDWHAAMKAYADWCHRVWKFRPYPSRLDSVVNMLAPGWGQDILFRDGKYRNDLPSPRCDCAELMSWWEWSPLGPKSIPLDELAKKLGEAKYKEWESYFVKDPVTGRLMFNNNPGDYDGYNARFGGLPALREAIHQYQKAGALVTLYTDPLRVDDNTKCGRQWGKLWGVVQSDGKYRNDYDAWRMCHDVADYRRWVAETMGRVIRETDANGIRLDEYGHAGSACFSTLHEHTFAEKGTTEWQRSIAETTKLVRQAMDEAKPGSVLTTEHPGYDFLMPFIEGCITYDLIVQTTSLRPLECNLQRFYFPECKAYELIYNQADAKYQKRFWNAVASFGSYYPVELDRLLRENRDVFSSRDCHALVPTETRYVYANRFSAGDKTIYTLFNASGHSLAAPMLKLHPKPGEHVFDLLHGKNADNMAEKDEITVNMFLPRNEVACLLQCPARLVVKRSGEVLEFSVGQGTWKSPQIAICDGQGAALAVRPLAAGIARCPLAELPKNTAPPVYAKLLDGDRLIDVAPLP